MQSLRRTTLLFSFVAITLACGPSATSNSNDRPDAATPLGLVTPVPATTLPAAPTEGGVDASPTKNGNAPMPIISQGLPAFASNGTPSGAIDADYSTTWRSYHTPSSASPDWLAIDLSSVPQASRTKVYSVWFNELGYNYDTSDAQSYMLPGNFELQANAAPGGGQLPSLGWVTLVTASANELSSGANMLDLTGYSWVRFLCTATAPNTAIYNTDVSLQWELFDAHANSDGWKFAGDSITANSMGHQKTNDSFDQLVHLQVTNDPAFEMAGHGYWSTSTLLQHIDAFLADFPGQYFAISLGTNDAPADDPVAYANNMTALIDKVLAAGKIPLVPTIPYTGDPAHAAIPQYNAQIQALYVKYGSKLVPGPDLYTVLYNGRAAMFNSPTDLHPNAAGNAAIRNAWADAMVHAVYGK